MSGKSSRVRKTRMNLPEGSGNFKTGLTPSVGRPSAVSRMLSLRGVSNIVPTASPALPFIPSTTTYYLGYPGAKIVQPGANASIPPITVVIHSDAKQVKITAVGGHGGGSDYGSDFGGRGAKVTTTYNLTTINITLLKLYIGGGGFSLAGSGCGGGGLTQVMSDNNVAINVVAGGGGGLGVNQKGLDASNGLITDAAAAPGSNGADNVNGGGGGGSRLILDGLGGLGGVSSYGGYGGFGGGGSGGFSDINSSGGGGGGGGYGGGRRGLLGEGDGGGWGGGRGGGSIALLNGGAQPYDWVIYANNEALGVNDIDGFVILELS
jgi:hypothetical protein